jgi:hypothetical protein
MAKLRLRPPVRVAALSVRPDHPCPPEGQFLPPVFRQAAGERRGPRRDYGPIVAFMGAGGCGRPLTNPARFEELT